MNIIYFNPDQLRADFLGCYGHPLARTPNIDQFATQGVRFDQCHVQHTVCSPSRCSFMTGWYPHVRGHRTLWHLLRPDEPHTLKYLSNAGYVIHWIGKNDLLTPEALSDCKAEIHSVRAGAEGNRTIFPKADPRYDSFLYGPSPDHHKDWYRVDRAIEVLRSQKPGDPPFFLYLPLLLPHCPFSCPQPWYDMYDPNLIPRLRPPDLEGKPIFHQLIRRYRRLDQLDDATFRKICAVYLGMISYVDVMLGRLVDALEESGLIEDTTIFFFSDHGEWAGDYGLVEKWPSALDDCLTRVPMIVRTPSGARNHVVHDPIECFDIMPTTLELAGIKCQHTHFARSMSPQLGGATGDPHRAVFAEGGYDLHEPHCFEGRPDDIAGFPDNIYYPKGLLQQEHPLSVARSTMIRTRGHKLIHRPAETSELYDLESDPHELVNLHGRSEAASMQRSLESQMLDWYVHTSDVVPFARDGR